MTQTPKITPRPDFAIATSNLPVCNLALCPPEFGGMQTPDDYTEAEFANANPTYRSVIALALVIVVWAL